MEAGGSSTTEESAWRLVDLVQLRCYLKPVAAEAVDEASYVAVLQEELRLEFTCVGKLECHTSREDKGEDMSMAQKIW